MSWEAHIMRACEPIACPCKVRSDAALKSLPRAEKKIEESARRTSESSNSLPPDFIVRGHHLGLAGQLVFSPIIARI